MNCSQTRKLLSAYVDGELFGREAADVAAHVEACPSCQHEFHDLTVVKDMVGRLPRVSPPASLYAGVMARLQETAAMPASEPRLAPAARASATRSPSRRLAWLRIGWKTGVAAAAVAALTFAWGMKLLPSAPPLVSDGGNPAVPPGQTIGSAEPPAQPELPSERAEVEPPAVEPPPPADTDPQVTPADDPPEQVTPEPVVTPPADETPAEEGDDTEAPDFGSRFGTAGAGLPGGDRLIAKTMNVSLAAADAESFAASLADLAELYGVALEPGDEGTIRLRVPQNDQTMKFISDVKELGLPDTFKWVKNSETDVTEAVRNLTAERDFLQRALADGDESVRADLELKQARLAEYFRDIEYLTIELTVVGLGS